MSIKTSKLKTESINIPSEKDLDFILSILRKYTDDENNPGSKVSHTYIPYRKQMGYFEDLDLKERMLYCYFLNKINVAKINMSNMESSEYLEWFHSYSIKVSYTEIAEWGLMNSRAVSGALDKLEEVGLITTVKRNGKGKRDTIKCNYEPSLEIPVQFITAFIKKLSEENEEIPLDIKELLKSKFGFKDINRKILSPLKMEKEKIEDDFDDW